MRTTDWDNSLTDDDKLISGGAVSATTGGAVKLGFGGKLITATATVAKGSAVGKLALAAGAVGGPPAVIAVGGIALSYGLYRKVKRNRRR